jgi:hypothetical protein
LEEVIISIFRVKETILKQAASRTLLVDPEDGGDTLLQNVG